eukprot:4608864-Prymnesium_polylepis.1
MINAWDASMAGFSPFKVRTTSKRVNVEEQDMKALLDEKGWLTNFISDAYMSTVMPELTGSLPLSAERAFLPGVRTHEHDGVPTP